MKHYRTMLNESEIRALVSDEPYQDNNAIKALCFNVKDDTTLVRGETISVTVDIKVDTLIDILRSRGPIAVYDTDNDMIKFIVPYHSCMSIVDENIYKE